ncbi:MAG: hypothetical protein EG826_17470 [Deltaproteobacteria bacterium]|nr:hypothetical protein [Deltaproteobacteria bacterium]
MKKGKILSVFLMIGIALLLCTSPALAAGKKVLFIDSYHTGYAWSDGQIQGAKNLLAGRYDFKVIHMDTKRNPAADAQKKAAERVKAEIDSWKPDVVIAADDNASKLVIVPFYKNSSVPFVFCGVNWDASAYGFPSNNVTGVLEVSVVKPLFDTMKKYAKGSRIAFLGKDNETDRKEADMISKKFGMTFSSVKFVNNFEEWKTAYGKLQDEADMLFVVNNAGINGWNDTEAKKIVREKAKIPTGSCHDFIAPFVLIDYAKLAEEQGELAAGMAIKILSGTSPKDIPVVSNKKGQMYVNLAIAKKLGIQFPLETLKAAKVINE